MKNYTEINEFLKNRYVRIEGIKDDTENAMLKHIENKRTKSYKDSKQENRDYFIRSVEIIRIYSEINEMDFVDALHELDAYKKVINSHPSGR